MQLGAQVRTLGQWKPHVRVNVSAGSGQCRAARPDPAEVTFGAGREILTMSLHTGS